MDAIDLQIKIEQSAKLAFSQVMHKYPNEDFCAYALYSDADATTICPSMNSTNHLSIKVAEDVDDKEYYRWSPAEWAYEFEGAEHFSRLSQFLLAEFSSMSSSTDRDKFKQKVYECCVSALENLKNEGFFAAEKLSPIVVFSISDSTNEQENNWISRLNDPAAASDFRKWLSNT
ncbi:DUF4303 domain-containing protein [Undibacterium sp. Ji50W]|uniref:DUF4303 domain-containing protein n=1 Tax=Undibacterium sp. Ji50W TaxID=3413041 RepID=UPI003BEFBAF5